jgi:hypothetical protein
MRNSNLRFLNLSVSMPSLALHMSVAALVGLALPLAAHAQNKTTYRCPSVNNITHFTDDKIEADRLRCTPLTGGNVTVIQSTKVFSPTSNTAGTASGSAAPVRVAAAPQAGSRIDGAEQRTRDSDSKGILETELKKAEAKQAELVKEYNNGEPAKLGPETVNNQKYLDRVAELKASIARNESDINSIRRELRNSPK